MARFEPSARPPRPRAPRSGAGPQPDRHEPHPDPEERIARADRLADDVAKLGSRKLLPTVSLGWMVPRFVRDRLPQLPPEVQYRLSVVSGFAQTIGLVVFGCLAVALIFQTLTRQTFTEPKNAEQVLDRARAPKDVSFSVETIRVKRIDGSLLRQDSLRGFQMRPGKSFRADVSGVTERTFRMAGDGKTALLQFAKQPAQVLHRYPAAQAVRPVLASDLKPVAGKLLDTKATVQGQRGWFVSFKPTGRLIAQMLSADLLRLQGEDIDAIRAGRFSVRYATATVTRSARRLYQIDTVIRVNGAQLRILITYRQQDTGVLEDFSLKRQAEELVN